MHLIISNNTPAVHGRPRHEKLNYSRVQGASRITRSTVVTASATSQKFSGDSLDSPVESFIKVGGENPVNVLAPGNAERIVRMKDQPHQPGANKFDKMGPNSSRKTLYSTIQASGPWRYLASFILPLTLMASAWGAANGHALVQSFSTAAIVQVNNITHVDLTDIARHVDHVRVKAVACLIKIVGVASGRYYL